MDTQSEQAPHTSSRIGNDRGNVSHFKNSFFLSAATRKLMNCCVKHAKDREQQACKAICSTEVDWMVQHFLPYFVFVVSP